MSSKKICWTIVRQKIILLDIVRQRFSHFLPDNVQQKNFAGHCPAEILTFARYYPAEKNFAGHYLAEIFLLKNLLDICWTLSGRK